MFAMVEILYKWKYASIMEADITKYLKIMR